MAGDKKVKLHATCASPYSNRVEIALKLKGVEYEHIEEDMSNKSPELLRHNRVLKKIPVLVHGSNPISESLVILEYIDETWGSAYPLLPRDPYERAQARFWAKFIDDKLFPSIRKVYFLGEEEAMEEARENMKVLDNELQGKRFFGGETIGFVDIVGNIIAYWLGIFEDCESKVMLTEEAFPSLFRWRDEFLNSEAVQPNLPTPEDDLVAQFKFIIQLTRSKNSQ